ncbi:MAG: VOC family protein [Nevskia sp.]|nr:VOC family protein [Nevskia sp.]
MVRIDALAYIVVESTDVPRWRRFGEQVVGMASSATADGGAHLKMDERAFRIAVVAGGQDRYYASGWEVADQAAFETVRESLTRARVPVERDSDALAASRCMQELLCFRDPSGNRHELGWGHRTDFARMVSPVGVPAFVTGSLGMGHTVLPAPKFDATWAFFRDVLGFGLADLYRHRAPGTSADQRIYFTHCANGRHHSLALFEGEVPCGCVHAMVELPSMDEVGRAYDRMLRQGVRLMATLGRHVNDRMVSFYVATPSSFALEIGYGGLVIDWTRHQVFESTAVSLWGHDFSIGFR